MRVQRLRRTDRPELMWQVANTTPFDAHGGFFRDQRDAHFWGLWVKAGFALRENQLPLFLSDQPRLNSGPVPAENMDNAIYADGDLVPPKSRIDLIVTAQAAQPDDGQPGPVVLRLGDWKKTLQVHPPSRWNWRGRAVVDRDAASGMVSFDGSHSFGGQDHDENPIGVGFGESTKQPLAPVSYRGDAPVRSGDAPRAAILGAISPDWPVRRRLAGTYDVEWQRSRSPLLPRDFDPDFFQCAPVDQQLTRPLADEPRLIAGGFDGTGPWDQPSSFPLTQLDLLCGTRIKGHWHSADAQVQTIHLDLIRKRLHLTYLAVWPIANASADVDIDLTKLALRSRSGFRVGKGDAHLFTQIASEPVS